MKRGIRDARPENPFKLIEMHDKILNFDPIKALVTRPAQLRVTKHLVIKVDAAHANQVEAKKSYDDVWESFPMDVDDGLRNVVPERKYNLPFPLKPSLKKDLTDMLLYMSEEPRNIWRGILGLDD